MVLAHFWKVSPSDPLTASPRLVWKPELKVHAMKAAKKKAPPQKAATTAKKKTAATTVKPKAASKKKAAKKSAPKKAAEKSSTSASAKKKAASKSSAPKKKTAAQKAPARKFAQKKTTKKKAVTRKAATVSKQKTIPAILLEGDSAPTPRRSGPGARYQLGPESARIAAEDELGELPESYGTGLLVATARDPHWLYVFWDLTDVQQAKHNKAARDGHLTLRLFGTRQPGQVISETDVHPESRNWFIPVPHAGQKYSVELGYFDAKDVWQAISESRVVATPPDSLADDTSADFATLPVEVPFEQLIATVRQVVSENVPLLEALEQLRTEGHEALPGPDYFRQIMSGKKPPVVDLTGEQKQALAEVITMDEVRRVWVGSHEITELVKKQLVRELASQAAAAGGARAASSAGVSSLSSPFGAMGEAGEKDFWFNVNAELIIYGATEPDATVTIGERRIDLRKDGTFSYRFALPDGQYDLPIQATSADGDDSRNADLSFSRDTQYRGDVGRHPQDPALKTPRPENTA